MTKQIVLSIFPKSYWLMLILGIVLRLFNDFSILSNIILNIVFTLFCLRIGVVLHEIGHLIFAKLTGGNPKRIILGKGHEVARFEISNVKIIVNNAFKGGLALATFSDSNYIKLKNLVYISGGPLTNFILAYLAFKLYGFNLQSYSGEFGIDISTGFIASNILLTVISLIPSYVNYNGIKIPTDGLSLIRLPFLKNKKVQNDINKNEIFTAFEYLEVKEYEKAEKIYKKYLNNQETELISKINLCIIYLKKGEIEKAYELSVNSLNLVKDKKIRLYRALVNNNLAWLCLIKQDFKSAEYYSKVAFSINPNDSNFKGTRGSVLIELGNVKQGLNMLKPLINYEFPNSQTLCASMYLYYGYLLNGKRNVKYLSFVTANLDKLDLDERIIWDNILIRCKDVAVHTNDGHN